MFDTEIIHNEVKPRTFSLLDRMYVERGTKEDWEHWSALHYKSKTMSAGSRCYRVMFDDLSIGVVVTALPKPLLKERNVLMPNIKAGNDTKITNTHRYNWANANIRVISRVVVDPVYRSAGAGYRATNLVSRMEGFRFMEIQSSMSKFNFFAQKAGFRFVKPMSSTMYDTGIRFFRTHFESMPQDLEALLNEIEAMPPRLREKTIEACKAYYYAKSPLEKTGNNAGRGKIRVAEFSVRETIKALQQLVIASPLYGFYPSPDYGTELPKRLYLDAFDNQGFNEPLRLDRL